MHYRFIIIYFAQSIYKLRSQVDLLFKKVRAGKNEIEDFKALHFDLNTISFSTSNPLGTLCNAEAMAEILQVALTNVRNEISLESLWLKAHLERKLILLRIHLGLRVQST